jgi:hypothetical protein
MDRVARPLYALALVLWVGALWAIGGIVAPTLFGALADRTLAGSIAGRLFSIVAWIGIGAAIWLMLFQILDRGGAALKTAAFWIVFVMFLLTLASQFGIQPLLAHLKEEAFPREVMQSMVRDRFAAWHGISSVLYVIESALGGVLVVWEFGGRR